MCNNNDFTSIFKNYNVNETKARTRVSNGFALDDLTLKDIVGSRGNKDIIRKGSWQAENSFNNWKSAINPSTGIIYPERQKYEFNYEDIDNDNQSEAVVYKNNKIVGINGYTTAKSDYPIRRSYYTEHPTKESRKEFKYYICYKKWKNR